MFKRSQVGLKLPQVLGIVVWDIKKCRYYASYSLLGFFNLYLELFLKYTYEIYTRVLKSPHTR